MMILFKKGPWLQWTKVTGYLIIALFGIFVSPLPAQEKYAIRDVSVIPMMRDTLMPGQTILISSGIIEEIGETSKISIPVGYHVIDGNGKYVLPGLFDMHAHFFNEQGAYVNTCEPELKLMLANGLTTVRIMAGHPNYLEARENVRRGTWVGPDLLVASPQFVGQWLWDTTFKNYEIVDTPEKAAAAVKKYTSRGYDAIKVSFMVDRPCYDAVIQTARESGIRVVGHVGPKVKLPAALQAGEQIEHMDEFIDMLLPDSTFNQGQSVSDMNLWRMAAWETVPYLDESKISGLVDLVKESGVYVTPTNYFFISCFGTRFTADVYRERPDYRYIPSIILPERWQIVKRNRDMNIPSASLEKYVELRKKMTLELWKGGVPLMAGSDSPEWFLVTGFSIHDEIATFVASGLTPFDALQTATTIPAKYLGEDKNKGTVEKGKIADLILLDNNPLQDIGNTRGINGVMKSGQWFGHEAIDKLLEDADILGD